MAETRNLLLDLPPELRTTIWDLVLEPYSAKIYFLDSTTRLQPPSLLQVNRFLRSETLPMYYGRTTFEFEKHRATGPADHKRVCAHYRKWLLSLGEAIRHIRCVSFDDDAYGSDCRALRIVLQYDAEGTAQMKVERVGGGSERKEKEWFYGAGEMMTVTKQVIGILEEKAEEVLERKGKLKRQRRGLTATDWMCLLRMYYELCGAYQAWSWR